MGPITLGALGAAGAGVAAHLAKKRRPKVDRWALLLAEWPEIAATAGIIGARLLNLRGTRYGWEADLQLQAPQTVRDALKIVPGLESTLRTRVGAVRVEQNRARADQPLLRVLEQDPLAEVSPWPGPAGRSILDPTTLGVFETGRPVVLELAWIHAMLAGLTGSGKSTTMQLLVGEAVAAPDAVVCGLDFKRGVELDPWAEDMWALGTDHRTGKALLRDVRALVDQRLDWLRAHKLKRWPVSVEHPALIVVIEEQAELVRQGSDLVLLEEAIFELGRAAGIWCRWGIQRPTMENLGSDTIRGQSDVRLCHRMKEPGDGDLAFYKGATAAGWTPHLLEANGTLFVSSEAHQVPRPARAYLAGDAQVRKLAAAHAGRQPRLELIQRPVRGSGPAPPEQPPAPAQSM